MNGVTYDAGALIAAERRNPIMLAIHQSSLDSDITPVVPLGRWPKFGGAGAVVRLRWRKC